MVFFCHVGLPEPGAVQVLCGVALELDLILVSAEAPLMQNASWWLAVIAGAAVGNNGVVVGLIVSPRSQLPLRALVYPLAHVLTY